MPRFNPERFPDFLYWTYQFLVRHDTNRDCIQAGAFLMLLLHKIGYPNAYRLTVGVDVINPALSRWTLANMTDPATVGPNPADGMYVRLGKGCERVGEVPAGNWAGHLVVVVPDALEGRHIVFDPTIGQVNSPSDGIDVPPIMFAARDGFVSGAETFKIDANGTQLRYTAYPDDLSFNETTDRALRQDIIDVTDDVFQQLRDMT